MRGGQFGDRLKMVRKRAGMSARELARRAGLASSHVQALESGRLADPTLSTVRALASALGLRLDEFLGPLARSRKTEQSAAKGG